MINKVKNPHFLKFVIIGIMNTIIHNAVYLTLLYFDVNYLLSNTLAWFISLTFSFFINCYYNFKVKPTIVKFIKFPTTAIPGFLFQMIGVVVLVTILNCPKEISAFLASLVAIPITFTLMKWILKDEAK